MKKKKPPQLLRRIADLNVSRREPSGVSACLRCMCKSCTGFGCPWVSKYWRYDTDGYKYASRRCLVCGYDMIYDCDFYTNHRRRRFFVRKRYFLKETKLDRLIKAVSKLSEHIKKNPPT